MDEWFSSQATAAERDAMSAIQLEYQFQGDNLGNLWWLHFQSLAFKHNGTTYQLPETAPSHCKSKSYTGAELYAQMDPLAIPQLTSPYQDFPPCPPKPEQLTLEQRESQEWWRSIRDEMIFRRFKIQIEGFQLNQLPPASSTKSGTRAPKPLTALTNKRRAAAAKDAGAELFMRKPKRGRTSSKNKNGVDETPELSNITFPTIQEYVKDVSENLNIVDVEKQEAYIIATSFDEWKLQTILNHSLLLYGVGSKRTLLNQFVDQLEADGDSVIAVDGFHKDVTIEGILDLIANSWLRGEKLSYNRYDVHIGRHLPIRPYGAQNYPVDSDSSLVQRASSISRALARRVAESKRPYYLVLHNIDGVGLRNPTAQEALAVLVSHSTTLRGLNAVRLVASVDHVNGPALLWDSSTCAQFHWMWKPVHTYRPHIEEVVQGTHTDEKVSSRVLPRHRRGDTHAPTEHKAIFTVLASLAPRHTEALQQLAGLQANQLAAARSERQSTYISNKSSWVNYKDLFRQCQHKCVVHADDQLRRFLQELKDHGVVEQSSGDDAEELLSYRIPHAAQTLKDILDFSHTT